MTVNVLGTKYSIHYKSPSEDKFLRGYGDFVTQQFYPCIGEAYVGYHVEIWRLRKFGTVSKYGGCVSNRF